MRRWATVSVVIAGGLAGGIAVAVRVAVLLWNRETRRSAALLRARPGAEAAPFSRDELAGLPAPVVRYFEFALTPGQPLVRNARFRQIGEFAMRAGSWSPFTAVEHFAVEPPGFLWDATIRMAPMMSFHVRDGYFAGEGALYGTLAAIVPVVNERATPVLASGELLRYLAEAPLFPSALLPREGISWTAIDDTSARATLTDGATTVSCDVHFGERGEIVRVSAMRYGGADGNFGLMPWVGHWRDYRRVDGMMIPMSGEAEWALPEGPFAYWRGRIVDARFEFARRTDT